MSKKLGRHVVTKRVPNPTWPGEKPDYWRVEKFDEVPIPQGTVVVHYVPDRKDAFEIASAWVHRV